VLDDDVKAALTLCARGCLGPRDLEDAVHLAVAARAGAGVLVTRDEGSIKRGNAFQDRVRLVGPEEIL
jgi:predicted nucleic acid-binding protein